MQVAENLAQLMYSVMMTGYMFRNAQYRLELQQSLEQAALLDTKEVKVLHFFFLVAQYHDKFCNESVDGASVPIL